MELVDATKDSHMDKSSILKKPNIALIKSEFILDEEFSYDVNLAYVSDSVKAKLEAEEGNDEERPRKRKKLRGQNKSRKLSNLNQSEKIDKSLCLRYSSSYGNNLVKGCEYGDSCIHTHDLISFAATKPANISDHCYLFEKYGYCQYGLGCRFSTKHIKDSEYINIINESKWDKWKDKYDQLTTNHLEKNVQTELWKKQYNFDKADKIIEEIKSEKPIGCLIDDLEKEPRNIKKLDLKDKLVLTPLTTVGNLPFRRICKDFGVDVTCGEMAVATHLLEGRSSEWALLRRHNCEDTFGVQLCGAYPDSFTRATQLISETCTVDFIDINMGCPLDFILKKGAGASLMNRQNKLNEIIYGMSQVIQVPITLKMRTGLHEYKNIAHKIVESLSGKWAKQIGCITIHGRSREQRYTKLADWEYIDKCAKNSTGIPVFGSGDIMSHEEYFNKLETHKNIAGISIGRGALIKPWIFTEIKERRHWDISSSERMDIIRKYVNYGLEHWGSDHKGVELTRKFLLEWLSFAHRYIPVGLLEVLPQKINERPPRYKGRDELESLMASPYCDGWVKISEMVLGKVPEGFKFLPKHKVNAYQLLNW